MTRKQAEKIGNKILDWCILEYGRSKYRSEYPFIETDYQSDNKKYYGEYVPYTENYILIYTKNCTTIVALIKTIIHEYWHYLQPPTWLARYKSKYKYCNNPYEIKAIQKEEDWKKCFNYLKKKRII